MNTYLKQRLEGLLQHFRAAHFAGGVSASANRGTEREAFLLAFLSQVLPPIYRAGTGEITDIAGNRSGQVDVVIECRGHRVLASPPVPCGFTQPKP
jgi:hypothetical protein